MKPETLSGLIIGLIAMGTVLLVLYGIKKTEQKNGSVIVNWTRVVCAVGGWVLITGLLAFQGVLASTSLPPRPMVVMLIGLILLVSFSFSSTGKKIVAHTPLHWLIFIQAFRVLVELWFYFSCKEGVFPGIMSFEGANHDIYAGLLAIVAGITVMKLPALARSVGVIFNLAGFFLLVNTLKTAATSFPSPIQQHPWDERFLQLGQFPFIYLPAVLVPIALGFHIISIKQIFSRAKDQPRPAVV